MQPIDVVPETRGGGDAEETADAGVKLTPAEAKRLRARLRCAENYYRQNFESVYRDCERLYQGDHWPGRMRKGDKSWRHRIVVNYLPHIVETVVASLAYQNPEITLDPQDDVGQDNEAVASRAANYYYRKGKAHRETKRALRDMAIYGFGVVLTGWQQQLEEQCPTEGRQPVDGEPVDPAEITRLIEEGKEIPPPIPAAKVLLDEPFCKRLDPRQLRVSPECDWVIDDMPWIGYVEVCPLEEVRHDPRYQASAVRKLKGNARTLRGFLSEDYNDDRDVPGDMRRVELWHYFEKRRRLHVVFCSEHDTPLLVENWYWKHERYPLRVLRQPSLENDFYVARPLLVQLEHMQYEINLARTQLAIHRARYNRKYLAVEGVLTEDGKKQLQSDEDGGVVILNAPSTNGVLTPLQDAPIHREVYESDQTAQHDLSVLSAVDQYGLGNAPSKRTTTTEVQAIQSAGGPRQQDWRLRYEEFCAEVAEDFLDLLQQWAQHTQALPIYDDAMKVTDWQPWTREEIQGDFHFKVFVGSTEAPDRQSRIKDIGYLLQNLAPFAQQGMVDLAPLLRQLVSLVPGIRDADAIIRDPMEAQMLGAGLPEDDGSGMGGPMAGTEMGGEQPPAGGLPPELLAQLAPLLQAQGGG